MSPKTELDRLALYFNKDATRDKIYRAIQFISKFLSTTDLKPAAAIAQDVDNTFATARKVFSIFKSIDYLDKLITPKFDITVDIKNWEIIYLMPLVKVNELLLFGFFSLNQIVWLGRSGIYKNEKRTKEFNRFSLYCLLASSVCTTLVEARKFGGVLTNKFGGKLTNKFGSVVSKMFERVLLANKFNEFIEELNKAAGLQQSSSLDEKKRDKEVSLGRRSATLTKAGLDIVVAIGLLKLAPKKVTPRVTGALGFISSVIACYQLYTDTSVPKLDEPKATVSLPAPTSTPTLVSDKPKALTPASASTSDCDKPNVLPSSFPW